MYLNILESSLWHRNVKCHTVCRCPTLSKAISCSLDIQTPPIEEVTIGLCMPVQLSCIKMRTLDKNCQPPCTQAGATQSSSPGRPCVAAQSCPGCIRGVWPHPTQAWIFWSSSEHWAFTCIRSGPWRVCREGVGNASCVHAQCLISLGSLWRHHIKLK